MIEQSESRKTKGRSPNFPFITLEQSLERVKQFYEKEKRGSAPFAVAAEHWNYSPSSSAAMQMVGALKSYGLVTDEGTGDDRAIRLTDLALRIVLDARPVSPERDEYKRQAALSPGVALDIYTKWDGALPSDANLNHYLVLDRKFNEETGRRVVQILKKNEEFTRLPKSLIGSGISDITEAPDEIESNVVSGSNEVTPAAGSLRISGNNAIVRNTATGMLRSGPASVQGAGEVRRDERIIGPTGDIVLSFFGEPSWEAYDFLRKYITLRLELLKPSPPSATRSESPIEGDAP